MARVNNSTPLERGIQAEESFKRLLGRGVRADKLSDSFDHFDFFIKFDVKKIRSTDEFGESNYQWVEICNIYGNTGWLYGQADYFAFETKRYWIIVDAAKLRAFMEIVVTDKTVLLDRKEPYRIYQRKGRKDRVVMLPILDLCYLGFMHAKI
jgi:hypothetical protein